MFLDCFVAFHATRSLIFRGRWTVLTPTNLRTLFFPSLFHFGRFNRSHDKFFDTEAQPLAQLAQRPSDPFRDSKEERVRAYRVTLRSLKMDETAYMYVVLSWGYVSHNPSVLR